MVIVLKREEAFYYKNLLMLGVFLLKCGDLRLHWGAEDLPKLNAKPPALLYRSECQGGKKKKERGAPWHYATTYSRGANMENGSASVCTETDPSAGWNKDGLSAAEAVMPQDQHGGDAQNGEHRQDRHHALIRGEPASPEEGACQDQRREQQKTHDQNNDLPTFHSILPLSFDSTILPFKNEREMNEQ